MIDLDELRRLADAHPGKREVQEHLAQCNQRFQQCTSCMALGCCDNQHWIKQTIPDLIDEVERLRKVEADLTAAMAKIEAQRAKRQAAHVVEEDLGPDPEPFV
jgi:hypothetical protein